MYHVISQRTGTRVFQSDNFDKAKAQADACCKSAERTEHFEVIETKQVYVTSTLNEVMKPDLDNMSETERQQRRARAYENRTEAARIAHKSDKPE